MKKFFLIAGLVSCYASPSLCQYPSFSRGDSLKIGNLKKILPVLKGRGRVDALNQLSELYGLFNGFGVFYPKKEIISNIYFYAKEANNEALRIDYKYGIAKSLLHLSEAICLYGEPSTGSGNKDTTIKRYLQQAIMMREDFLHDSLTAQGAGIIDHGYEVAKSLLALSEAIDLQLQPFWVEPDTVTKKCLQQVIKIGEKLHNDSILGAAYYYMGWFVQDKEINYKKAIFHFHKAGELQKETEVTWQLCASYVFKGQYEDGFPYCEKCSQLSKANAMEDSSHQADRLVQQSDYYMNELYQAAGDYETAMDYLLKDNNYAAKENLAWKMDLSISDLYCKMLMPDSALSYWSLWKKDYNNYHQGLQLFGNGIRATIYIQKSQPDSAIPILENEIAHGRMLGPSQSGALIKPLLLRAEVYKQKKDYKRALQDAREAVEYAEQENSRMMDGYQLLSFLYYRLGQYKDAYETLVKYLSIKDSIQTRQFLIRLNDYKRQAEDTKKESRIGFLSRDNQIKQQQLKQKATFRNCLIAVFIAVVFAGLYVFRNSNLKAKNERLKQQQKEQEWKLKELENEKKQAVLQQQASELEMQALRAQMNPHFIFNCLSSINRIILRNETQTASDYLTRFSRLIRMVLINSQKSIIALEDELQMLRLYLDMERLRFKDSFDYRIIFANTIDEGAVFIPPLLLQPFCENAIWHGLMQKDSHGHLTIELSMQEKVLQCVIEDDGIGREAAEALRSKSAEKQKSMGLQITAQRLALLSQSKHVQSFYSIEDRRDEENNILGTRVMLRVYYNEMAEQIV